MKVSNYEAHFNVSVLQNTENSTSGDSRALENSNTETGGSQRQIGRAIQASQTLRMMNKLTF
jgi:hypothetical protein